MFTLEEIQKITRGKIISGDKNLRIKGVSIDSRTIKKGDLFIAIKGPHFDGHKFISEAVKKGAKAIIASTPNIHPVCVWVGDTTEALGLIAGYYRKRFDIPVIAITGSTGKTTTKEMLAAVLSSKFKVLKNFKTENNHYGVPLTLLKLTKKHQAVVLELGTNQPGDIAWLAKIVNPTVALFTNVGASHLQGLRSPYGVFLEKKKLIKYLALDGCLIFNQDDYYLKKLVDKKMEQKKVSYGCSSKAAVQGDLIQLKNTTLTFRVKRKVFSLKTSAEHNILNALAAISCGRLYNIPYDHMITSLKKFYFPGGRKSIKKIRGGWLIDDTYNANPVSFASAVQMLDHFQTKGRKILVCGDMVELGQETKKWHQKLGKNIAGSSIDIVLGFGVQMKSMIEEVKRKSLIETKHYQDMNSLCCDVKCLYKFNDVILIKGSRSMRMERVIEGLK